MVIKLTKLYYFSSNKYEGLPKRKTKATWFHKTIFLFKSPSSKGSKFKASIHIYINMLLTKTQTGRELL